MSISYKKVCIFWQILGKFLTPVFIFEGQDEIHTYSYAICLLLSNAVSRYLNTKQMYFQWLLATDILFLPSVTCSLFCNCQTCSCKLLCLSTRKSSTLYISGCVEPIMTLKAYCTVLYCTVLYWIIWSYDKRY